MHPLPRLGEPERALRRADGQGLVAAKEVELGPESGNDVVVESGLEVGESVIVEGLQRVRPGLTVNTQPWTDPGQG